MFITGSHEKCWKQAKSVKKKKKKRGEFDLNKFENCPIDPF